MPHKTIEPWQIPELRDRDRPRAQRFPRLRNGEERFDRILLAAISALGLMTSVVLVGVALW